MSSDEKFNYVAECARLREELKATNERWRRRQENWRDTSERAHRATQRAWADSIVNQLKSEPRKALDLPADVAALVREMRSKDNR